MRENVTKFVWFGEGRDMRIKLQTRHLKSIYSVNLSYNCTNLVEFEAGKVSLIYWSKIKTIFGFSFKYFI